MGDHAIQIAALGGDGDELPFSEGLQHPAPSLLADAVVPKAQPWGACGRTMRRADPTLGAARLPVRLAMPWCLPSDQSGGSRPVAWCRTGSDGMA